MKLETIPFGLIAAGVAVAAVLAILASAMIVMKASSERRAVFGRYLGKAFIFLIALTMLAAALQQWGR